MARIEEETNMGKQDQNDTSRSQLPIVTPADGNPPIRPMIIDEQGVLRFRVNQIVRDLLDLGSLDLNAIALREYSRADREELAMLIGYSVSGISELSYMRRSTIRRIDEYAEPLYPLLEK
jgi:hypothetical protein